MRIGVGPFADPAEFERSGARMAHEISQLCTLARNAHVLELGCGCGRLARAFAGHLSPEGAYEGCDVDAAAIAWCKQNLAPHLPNFHFTAVDVRAGSHNPLGSTTAEQFRFPYPETKFDLVIAASLFTHMLPDGIANYVSEVRRVLKPEGRLFMSVFLFDEDAQTAVRNGTTIFNFANPIGPCLTFDAERPEEGIACQEEWLIGLLNAHDFSIEHVQRGNWRTVNSYAISQDYVIASCSRGHD